MGVLDESRDGRPRPISQAVLDYIIEGVQNETYIPCLPVKRLVVHDDQLVRFAPLWDDLTVRNEVNQTSDCATFDFDLQAVVFKDEDIV